MKYIIRDKLIPVNPALQVAPPHIDFQIPGSYAVWKNAPIVFKDGVEHPTSDAIYIGVIPNDPSDCPFCGFLLVPAEIDSRKCFTCHRYICFDTDTLPEIIEIRTKSGVYSQDLIGGTKPIYYFFRESPYDSILLHYVDCPPYSNNE